jgi:hypothetical protein
LFEEIDDLDRFDLIYFDAFGYRVQPNYGHCNIQKNMMQKTMALLMLLGVVKSMIEVGFKVEN